MVQSTFIVSGSSCFGLPYLFRLNEARAICASILTLYIMGRGWPGQYLLNGPVRPDKFDKDELNISIKLDLDLNFLHHKWNDSGLDGLVILISALFGIYTRLSSKKLIESLPSQKYKWAQIYAEFLFCNGLFQTRYFDRNLFLPKHKKE